MKNRGHFLVLAIALLATGCSEFDKSKIPLYDELLVAPPEDNVDPRRTPMKNPIAMPPGYRKPNFNEYQKDRSSNLNDILKEDADTSLQIVEEDRKEEFPELANVPPRPEISSAKELEKTYDNLAEQRDKAIEIQQAVQEGREVPQSMIVDARPAELPEPGQQIASLPWTGNEKEPMKPGVDYFPEHAEGLNKNLSPITFEAEEEKASNATSNTEKMAPSEQQAAMASKELEHEYGMPKLVEGGEHSSITNMHNVGYKSVEEKELDQQQLRLKEFEFKNVPVINSPKINNKTQLSFNDVQSPPKFLPESRYRARRINGPHYANTYNGATYFKN